MLKRLGSAPLWKQHVVKVKVISRPTISLGVTPRVWHPKPDICYRLTVANLLMRDALSYDREDLSFAVAASTHQRNHSRIQVLRKIISELRISKPRGPYLRVPQEGSSPVIFTGNGFQRHLLLQLSGLKWRYCNPPVARLHKDNYTQQLIGGSVKLLMAPSPAQPFLASVSRTLTKIFVPSKTFTRHAFRNEPSSSTREVSVFQCFVVATFVDL
jgi:hypothetical protein